jgi:hypothetical protein
MQPKDIQPDEAAQPYEPPRVEDVETTEQPSATAAGQSPVG